jgi:alkanesulfonate monooxygenase SsuD/methylene tetrahydromethanopterin reductase-like flavin-dependent oxidoreductase (luciferase family)
VFGDPDSVGEQLAAVKATGVDGFTINLAVNGYMTERIALLGEIAGKVLG